MEGIFPVFNTDFWATCHVLLLQCHIEGMKVPDVHCSRTMVLVRH